MLRPARPDDADRWHAAFSAVAAEGRWIGAEAPVSEFAPKLFAAHLSRDSGLFLLADAEGDVVGWMTAEPDDLGGGGGAELGMGIVERSRRRGIGSLMVAAAVDWAESAGVDRLHLEVFPHNEPAIRLYRRFGFVEVDRRIAAWPRRSGERWDLLVMERRPT